MTFRRCVEYGTETRQECAEYRDDGYNSCASWDANCCDWWPCSWGCKLITWLCVAWYWVSNIVCVAWTWVATSVCVAWEAISIVARVVKEAVWRFIGIVDFVGSLVGIRPKKFLRLKIFILLDLKHRPVHPEVEVNRWLDETKTIFAQKMNVELHPANLRADEFVNIMAEPAPDSAMFPSCSFAAGFGEAAEYYEENSAYSITSVTGFLADKLGYGEPIFAFVVHSIAGGDRQGCAYPLIRNVCMIATNARTTTLAHEIGHLCGLTHHSGQHNLMNSDRDDMDSDLTRWQISVFRNSRYVTYLNAG